MSVAIITEFNPFHYGHEYIIRKAAEVTGEPVLCVMSGPFVQRGEPAIASKYARAEAALRCGAAAVVELPVRFAISAAQNFAKGGIEVIKRIKNVNYLAFGVENAELDKLYNLAALTRSSAADTLIRKNLSEGLSYPTAVANAVKELGGEELSFALSSPNNILAVEYIKALDGTDIKPLPIERVDGGYNSLSLDGEYASASAIRSGVLRGEDVSKFLPEFMMNNLRPFDQRIYESLIRYALLRRSVAKLRNLPDVENGFEYALYEAAKLPSLSETIAKLKTKRYTYARIKRILLYALLDIDRQIMSDIISVDARVLGIKKEFKSILSDCSDGFILRNCDINSSISIELDAKAEAVYSLITGRDVSSYYTTPLLTI